MTPSNVFALLAVAMLAALPAAAAPVQPHQPVPGASPEPIAGPSGVKDVRDLEAFVDGVMTAHLKQNGLAGATLAIVKDGKPILVKGYGYADIAKGVRVDGETSLFRPGSTSKLFTWTAVMQLVEQGKLDLDADVNGYLTDFKLPSSFDAPVTLRNLLTHTAGFEDGGIGYLFAKKPEQLAPLHEFLAAHMPARVRPPTTDFNDGTNSSYSNWGTALAGLVVANVSGVTFDEYIEKNIFEPLGMTSSTFREPLPPHLAPHMATGYAAKNGRLEPHDFELIHNFGPAGSLTSSAADMAKFMIAQLHLGAYQGKRILREDTAKLMQSRQLSPSPHVNGGGLGFYETWVNGRRAIGHGGDTLYFHSDLFLLPEDDFGVFVSYNASHGEGPGIARRDLMRSIMDRYYPARLPPITPPADFDKRAGDYAGGYRFIRHSHTTFEKMFGLFGALKVIGSGENTLMLTGLSEEPSHWVEVAPDVFREHDGDETIVFIRDADGGVTHLSGVPLVFIPAYKLAWYEGPMLHYLILGFGALCFLVAIVSALRNWKTDRAGDRAGRQARRVAAALGVVQLAFLALLGVVLSGDLADLIFEVPRTFHVALAFPLLAIPLTLAVLYFTRLAWNVRSWSLYSRIQYGVIAAMSVAFLWSLHFWNLIGYRFG